MFRAKDGFLVRFECNTGNMVLSHAAEQAPSYPILGYVLYYSNYRSHPILCPVQSMSIITFGFSSSSACSRVHWALQRKLCCMLGRCTIRLQWYPCTGGTASSNNNRSTAMLYRTNVRHAVLKAALIVTPPTTAVGVCQVPVFKDPRIGRKAFRI